MKYYYDTEFIEGFHKPWFGKRRHFIELISIGIVAEDGREYYAVSSDYSYGKASEWVRDNVIMPLFREQNPSVKELSEPHTFHLVVGKSNETIAREIFNFIHAPVIKAFDDGISFSDEIVLSLHQQGHLETHELYAYYSDYDHVLLCSIFGTMMDLPKGFPMYTRDLKQILDDKVDYLFSCQGESLKPKELLHIYRMTGEMLATNPNFSKERILEGLKNHYKFPIEKNAHNALSDAKWNKKLHEFILTI